MALSYRGSVTLGACVPLAAQAQAQLSAAVGASLPDGQARCDGLVALSTQPPPALDDLLAALQALIAAIQALLANPLPDVSANAAAQAELLAQLGALTASLTFSADLAALLGTPGVHLYFYQGRADGMGNELQAHLGAGLAVPSSAEILSAALVASDGGAINALRAMTGG